MAIRIYDTASRNKEEFHPQHGNRVNFYSCGPTVYDYFHIGNARPLIMFDIFRRYLEYRGYEVNYIVNITDIDDKIINRANREGIAPQEVAKRFTEAFFEGIDQLGVRRATVHPFATQSIGDMIALIRLLIERGHAYQLDGDVYFDIRSFPSYGKLSGRNLDELQAGARVEVNDRKHGPLDFALWKASKPGEPSWESPWGPGRPGWHIECSAMAMRYAGGSLDIHAGGQDLIFPHHENEIAQAEAATGQPFVRYWMHNGFLDIEGEKMSKSLGNFLTVRDILKKYDPMAIRTFFLLKHYRSPIDFSEERMQEARAAFLRLKRAWERLERLQPGNGDKSADGDSPELEAIRQNRANMEEALDDDFNTAKAMGHFFEIARIINQIDDAAPVPVAAIDAAREVFTVLGTDVFGLDFTARTETGGLADGVIGILIDLRREARAAKNFALADTIRKRLAELGVQLEDRPEGTTWKTE